MPMDDASPAPGEEEMDPNMMDGGVPEEAPMGDDMAMDPGMNGDTPEAGGEPNDETMEIINQLSPKDKEAVKSYAESLVSKNEDNNDSEMQEEVPQDGLNMETPMNESFIFNKKQLNKLMENFGPTEDELESNKTPNLIKKQKNVKKSPFNAPDFV